MSDLEIWLFFFYQTFYSLKSLDKTVVNALFAFSFMIKVFFN